MALTEREHKLCESLRWLANVHHQLQHQAMKDKGMLSFMECDAKTCKYAADVMRWADPDNESATSGSAEPGDGVLTDAQRAAFGMPSRHQVIYCQECQSGTRLVGTGEVVHEPGCGTGKRERDERNGKAKEETTDVTDTAAEVQLSDQARAVLDCLGDNPLSSKVLQNSTGLDVKAVRKATKELVDAGKARKEGASYVLAEQAAPATPTEAASDEEDTDVPTKASTTKKAATKRAATKKAATKATAPAKKAPAKKAAAKKATAPAQGSRQAAASANDEKVLAVLKANTKGLTQEEVGKKSGVTERTYASLWRLMQKDQAHNKKDGRTTVWFPGKGR